MKTCVECGGSLDGYYHNRKTCDPCRPAQALRRSKIWYEKNKARKKAYDEKRRIEKRDLYRAASRRFGQNHPERKNAYTQLRRARQKQRFPAWADRQRIRDVYEGCPADMVVDHIIPLQGKIVSGLHVHDNLQYLTQAENTRKLNHYEVIDL